MLDRQRRCDMRGRSRSSFQGTASVRRAEFVARTGVTQQLGGRAPI
jgi:hypothetical protein